MTTPVDLEAAPAWPIGMDDVACYPLFPPEFTIPVGPPALPAAS